LPDNQIRFPPGHITVFPDVAHWTVDRTEEDNRSQLQLVLPYPSRLSKIKFGFIDGPDSNSELESIDIQFSDDTQKTITCSGEFIPPETPAYDPDFDVYYGVAVGYSMVLVPDTVSPSLEETSACGGQYASFSGMLKRFHAKELAQLADKTGLVDGELMTLAMNDADISAYEPEKQTAANNAIVVLCRAITDADNAIELHVSSGGYVVPIEPPISSLQNAACDIARYYLYDSGELEEKSIVYRRYKDAATFLSRIASGTLKLPIASAASDPDQSMASIVIRAGRFST
ncbi:MAG: DUF1320 domain-containing protein, partial [Gammaproteobacteria bacterium]|nr:DUF1320 domain-containing protein [Gammaproteobacteria bacterium]